MGSVTDRTDRARRQFLDELWRGMLILALVGVPLSLSRIVTTGWLPIYGAHLVIGGVILAVFAAGSRLGSAWRAAVLIALLWAIGLFGLFTIGFPAISAWWLVLSCLVASTFYSIRAGLMLAIATVAVIALAAIGFIGGHLAPTINATDTLRSPGAWAMLILVLGSFTFAVLRSNWAYHRALDQLLAEVHDQRDRIERMAMHDPLTGLPVARLADDRIAMAMHQARRSGKKVALLFIDLDDFKQVNDSLGHQAGDAVLQEAARRLASTIRAQDTAARIGGDELLAVLADLSEDALAALVAKRIIHALSAPIDVQGKSVQVGASIGIALFPDHSDDPQTLRILADQAMYVAKRNGKNGYAFAERRESDQREAMTGST